MVHHQDPEPPPEQCKKVDVPLEDILATENDPEKDLEEQTDKDITLIIALSQLQTRDYHQPSITTPHSTALAPPNRTLTTQNLISRDQNTRIHSLHKPTHKSLQQANKERDQQSPTTSPRQAKQTYIAKWLQGLRSMSTLSSSASSKTKSGNDGESSSVEVVAARDAKGRGKRIRIVSDEVEEDPGVAGEEVEV